MDSRRYPCLFWQTLAVIEWSRSMTIKTKDEVLEALSAIEGIDKEVIEAIKGLGTNKTSPDSDDLKEAKATSKRILDEKKKLQAKVAEYEEQMEELKNADMSELEKLQKQIEKVNKSNEALAKQYEDAQNELTSTKRNHGLGKISSKLQFVESLPEYMRDIAIKEAFKDVEDLDDTDAVNAVFKEFKESHKGILKADNPLQGTGSKGKGEGTSGVRVNKDPDRQSPQERLAAIKNKL